MVAQSSVEAKCRAMVVATCGLVWGQTVAQRIEVQTNKPDITCVS